MREQIGHLAIGTRQFRAAADRLMRRELPVESLAIRSKDGDVMPEDLARALGSAPCLRGLRKLEVDEMDLGIGALAAVTMSDTLRRLEELTLAECDWHSRLGPRIAEAIAGADRPWLRSVRLAVIELRDEGFDSIFRSSIFHQLEELRLVHVRVTDRSVAKLVASPRALAPAQLVLSGPLLSATALAALRDWDNASGAS